MKFVHCFFLLFLLAFSAKGEAKPFVVGDLQGQLGNQMFQIATAVSVALDHNADVYFPDLAASQQYDLPTNYRLVFFRLNAHLPAKKITTFTHYETNFTYTPISFKPRLRIHGYFQSWKYFDH